MKFSSSLIPGRPIRVVKILFQNLPKPDITVAEQTLLMGDLRLPKAILTRLIYCLNQSNEILPESAKTLQCWKVGLLERFEEMPRP